MILAVHGELTAHLCGHEGVRNPFFVKVFIQIREVQADVVADDDDGRARGERRIHVHHAGIEAEGCIGGHLVTRLEAVITPVPMAESHEVPVFQLAALGLAGGPGGVQQDEEVFRLGGTAGCTGLRPDIGQVLGQQHRPLVIDFLQQFFLGDEELGGGVLHHEVQALGGVAGIQRLVGAAGLEHAQGGEHHPLAAADENGHHGLGAFAGELPDLRRDGIGLFVHLLVREPHVMIHDGQVVRRFGGLGTEQGDDGLAGVIVHVRHVEAVQQGGLLLVHQGQAAERCPGIGGKGADGLHHAPGEALHHGLAVLAVVILDGDGGLALHLGDIEGDLELGNVEFHGFVDLHRFSAHAVVAEDADLVGEHDVGLEVVVGGDAGERIVFVGEGLFEGRSTFVQEFLHALAADLRTERQGVHEHAHGIGDLQVAAPVGDGGDAHVVAAREAGQAVEDGAQQDGGRIDALGLGQLLGVFPHEGFKHAAVFSLRPGIGQVRCHFRHALHIGEALLEESGGSGEVFAPFGCFLLRDELRVAAHLRFDLLSVQEVTEFVDEKVVGIAVAHQVMDVAVQVQVLFGLDDGIAEETLLREVEGVDEALAECVGLLFGHRVLLHLHRRFTVAHDLDDARFIGGKLDKEGRMVRHGFLHRRAQGIDRDVIGKMQAHRRVIQRGHRILHALEIHARLGVGQRDGRRDGVRDGLLPGTGGSRDVPGKDGLRKNLILDRLDASAAREELGIQLDAEALVDLRGQFDRQDGGQSGHAEVRRQAEGVGVHDGGDHVLELLLQDIERGVGFFLRLDAGADDRFGQGAAVHFLVLVQRDGVDLHRGRRDHVGRFPVHDEGVQGLDIDLLVGHDVGGDVFAAGRILEGLHRGVLDTRELPDDRLHLLEFDAETADLHLAVLPAHEFDVPVLAVADDIAGAVHPLAIPVHESGGRLLRLVQIAGSHLRSGDDQLTRGTPGELLPIAVDDEQFHVAIGLADGDIGFVLIDIVAAHVHGRFRGSVGVEQGIGRRVQAHELLSARSQPLQARDVGEIERQLGGHLGGHENVGHPFLRQIVVEPRKVEADIVLDDVKGRAGPDAAPEVHLEGVETVTGIGGVARAGIQVDVPGIVVREDAEILLGEDHALGRPRGAAGVQDHEGVVAVIGRCVLFHEGKPLLGIAAVQGKGREAGLGDGKGGQHHPLVAGDGESHHALPAADGIGRVDAVGEPVHLGEGEPLVAGHAEDVVRPLGNMLAETLHEGREGVRRLDLGIQSVQPLHLLRRGVFQVLHGFCRHHRMEDRLVAPRKLLHEHIRVIGAVIGDLEGIDAVGLEQLGTKLPARCRLPQILVMHGTLPEMQAALAVQDGALVHEGDLVVQAEVLHCVLISVELHVLGFLHLVGKRREHIAQRCVPARLDEHGQGMDHHRDGGQGAAVAAAEIDGAVRGLVLGAVGRQEQAPGRLHQRTFTDIPFAHDLLDVFLGNVQREMLVIHPGRRTGLRALRQRQGIHLGRVAEGLRIPVPHLGHPGLVGPQRLFLLGDGPAIDPLAGGFLPVEAALDLPQHQHEGESVAKYMVEIDIQPGGSFGPLIDDAAVQPFPMDVHGGTQGGLRLVQRTDGDHRNRLLLGQETAAFHPGRPLLVHDDAGGQGRMGAQGVIDGAPDFFQVQVRGKVEQDGILIVRRGVGRRHAGIINALLALRERKSHDDLWANCLCF